MDITAIEGTELTAVEFVTDYLRLRFGDAGAGPMLTLYVWPHVLLADFSVEFESGTVIALSLREEDIDGPESGSYSEDGSGLGEEEF
jgi:hypothetical protein